MSLVRRPAAVRARLMRLAGRRLTKDGVAGHLRRALPDAAGAEPGRRARQPCRTGAASDVCAAATPDGRGEFGRPGNTMNRNVVAFIIAPLAVPLVMSAVALQILREAPPLYWSSLLIATMVSYIGVLLVGAPVYMTHRSRGWTSFWLALVAGLIVGVIMAMALVVIFPLLLGILTAVMAMFGENVQLGEVIIADPNPAAILVLMGPGILGALVGSLLWLIGRPDRP